MSFSQSKEIDQFLSPSQLLGLKTVLEFKPPNEKIVEIFIGAQLRVEKTYYPSIFFEFFDGRGKRMS